MCTSCGTDWEVDWKASTGSRNTQLTARLISWHQVYVQFVHWVYVKCTFCTFYTSHKLGWLDAGFKKCQHYSALTQQAPRIAEFGDMCNTLCALYFVGETLWVTLCLFTPISTSHIKCTICTSHKLDWLDAGCRLLIVWCQHQGKLLISSVQFVHHMNSLG